MRVPPQLERRTPRCTCGSREWRVDWYRTTRRESREALCHCAVMHFPHSRYSCTAVLKKEKGPLD